MMESNGPEVHANTTGVASPEKGLHPEVIREQNLAHIIQKTGNPREPGPCFQCLRKRWSKKASSLPVCMVAIDGKSSKCAWCFHQHQACTDGKPPQKRKKKKQSNDIILAKREQEREIAHNIQDKGRPRVRGSCFQCLHRKKSTTVSYFSTCMVGTDGSRSRCAWCIHQNQSCTDKQPSY